MSGQWGEYESVYNYIVSKQYPEAEGWRQDSKTMCQRNQSETVG